MRSGATAALAIDDVRSGVGAFMRRQAQRLGGIAIMLTGCAAIAAVATWNVADPSFSYATDSEVTNALGFPGAAFADLVMQFFGLASVFFILPVMAWGFWLWRDQLPDRPGKRTAAWFFGSVVAAGVFACSPVTSTWPLPTGLGGVFGDVALSLPGLAFGGYPTGVIGAIIGLMLCGPAIWLLAYACGSIKGKPRPSAKTAQRVKAKTTADTEEEFEEDEDRGGRFAFVGAMTHAWLSFRAALHRASARREAKLIARGRLREPELDPTNRRAAPVESIFEIDMDGPVADRRTSRGRSEPVMGGDEEQEDIDLDMEDDDLAIDDDEDDDFEPPVRAARAKIGSAATVARSAAKPQKRGRGGFELPALQFLSEAKNVVKDPSLSKDALEENARLLEGVLEDFGVKGEIINVRPGPVVTLYELEPAPGIKSSRVIGLADDIARSMSAIAARVAVVPGRNAIGIELPNSVRETVYLREMLASRDFETAKAKLALGLGKTINGEPVIADLAKMPHLLVAGTTGSGKSVAINTMILSLVYRMTPQQCRLIMIDPKMLELSVYDGIPHLLTPVVTDPKKAVVALKWTVREMEDRYRKMSKVGVRNIDGFNQRIDEARSKGEQITRTVQTGFDRTTGEAIYETEELDLEAMPFIVVIIDEMADLMMVAGKDIEGAVQRLAQMARAAGIHVIMATQRPSVDVITGTIKANFPTRISFQVTSKIDSRTILGEQGAEQLLGMGDMLYMAGGGRIQRVHGPFVSDSEVEKVVQHLKTQGVPEYLDAITEEEDEDDDGEGGGGGGGAMAGNFDESDDPYDQAVAVVLRDKKASTSYIQRRLGIGYNRAASIIERMEQDGIVGPANHAGKREILVPTQDD
jgi:S-DNA-T family DNA segregation ATPase FtsK/SpoIIIE